MKLDISLRQLHLLEAAAAGRLHRGPHEDERRHTGSRPGIWRIEGGRAVTCSANLLIDRGLLTETEPLDDGRIGGVVTELGQAVLDDLADRGPQAGRPKGMRTAHELTAGHHRHTDTPGDQPMKTKVSAKQHAALTAAAETRLYRENITHTWWIETGPTTTPHAATTTGRTLLRADWVRLRPAVDGRCYARLTPAGRQALETAAAAAAAK